MFKIFPWRKDKELEEPAPEPEPVIEPEPILKLDPISEAKRRATRRERIDALKRGMSDEQFAQSRKKALENIAKGQMEFLPKEPIYHAGDLDGVKFDTRIISSLGHPATHLPSTAGRIPTTSGSTVSNKTFRLSDLKGRELVKSILAKELADSDREEKKELLTKVLRDIVDLVENDEISIERLMEQIDMSEEEKSKEALALEKLAASMSEHWSGVDFELDPVTVSLGGSISLTIYRQANASKPGFSKKGHIGGEEFVPVRAYVGKRGAIICVFKPVAVEDYSTAEMPLDECFQFFTKFQRHFVEAGFAAQYNAVNEARVEKKREEDMQEFGNRYQDFGSF